MAYILYVNRSARSVRVHRDNCTHLRKHGGISRTPVPSGFYIEGLGTFGQAMAIGRWLCMQIKHPLLFRLNPGGICRRCNPSAGWTM